MNSPTQQELLRKLGQLCELSPDVRFGQLLAHLGFLAEDEIDRSVADIDDQQLLNIMERHRGELSRRKQSVA